MSYPTICFPENGKYYKLSFRHHKKPVVSNDLPMKLDTSWGKYHVVEVTYHPYMCCCSIFVGKTPEFSIYQPVPAFRYFGCVKCSPKDQYHKKIGRQLSFEKALNKIPDDGLRVYLKNNWNI